jgi:hypothetical protein
VPALVQNLSLKALSLGLALALWFVIAGEKTSEIGFRARVELQNIPPDLELIGEPANEVELRLRASPSLVRRLDPGDVSAQVDLAGLAEGEHILHLGGDAIRLPFGVRVVRITPSILTFTLERTLARSVPVRPRLLGRPAAGFEVAEVAADPPEVRIAGPLSRVQKVDHAFTEPVNVEGARLSLTAHVNLGLDDAVLRVQGAPRVKVTALVRELLATRELPPRAIEVRNGPGRVVPAQAVVVLTGPDSALRAFPPEALVAYVDLSGGRTGRVPVAVALPAGYPGVSVKETRPAEVGVRPARPR